MERIAPRERIRKQLDQLLGEGVAGQGNLLGTLIPLGTQLVMQGMLERETREQLGRAQYQHRQPGEALRGYRNGYEPGRLRTAEGEIPIQVPQVREWVGDGAYQSRLMSSLRGHSEVLEKLAVQMYSRGLSVRDVEDALREATGQTLLSRDAVSELSDVLWQEYQAFAARDLSAFEVEYLFIDALYPGLREWGCSQGILCAWGICRNGCRVMLHLALGSRESYDNCLEFLRGMTQRGLRTPLLVATDGAPGLIRAVSEVWGKSLRQRCLAHKMRNILDKVPQSVREEVKRRVQDVFYAPSLEIARERAAQVLHDYQEKYSAAMRSFNDDLQA
jgi:putative transposase